MLSQPRLPPSPEHQTTERVVASFVCSRCCSCFGIVLSLSRSTTGILEKKYILGETNDPGVSDSFGVIGFYYVVQASSAARGKKWIDSLKDHQKGNGSGP